jgi:hypothetical protein
MPRADIDYIVLDALANDLESLEDIVRLANHPDIGWQDLAGGAIAEFHVTLALPRLIEQRLVQVYELDADANHLVDVPFGTLPTAPPEACYFGLTAAGRLEHAGWKRLPAPARGIPLT